MRTLAMPETAEPWSLTRIIRDAPTLRELKPGTRLGVGEL
jgi:hypothetical protein